MHRQGDIVATAEAQDIPCPRPARDRLNVLDDALLALLAKRLARALLLEAAEDAKSAEAAGCASERAEASSQDRGTCLSRSPE